MAKQRKINDAVKAFIVTQLACFDPPSVVAEAVQAEFGLKMRRQQVDAYNPLSRSGVRLSARWKTLFDATRKEFLEKAAEIPVAHRSVRLRKLQRMVDQAEKMKNLALAAQLLEQIAKEVGDAYTNKRQLMGPGGGPIQSEVRTLNDFYAGSQRLLAGPAHPQPGA